MNLKFGWKTAVTVLSSLALAIGLAGCGSSDQSNPPLVNTDSVVELVNASLQYDATGTTISGTITTNYPTTLSGVATLSGFSADITGCSVNTVTVGTGGTITYTDNNNITSNVEITLTSGCSATAVALIATETDDSNATSTWSKTASVTASGDVTSPIAAIIPDTATQNVVLTQNNEPRTLVLKVYDSSNVPVTTGSISVRYPSEVLNGVDVGSLSPVKTADINANGEAIFSYTGPSDLIGLLENNITSATFVFYDTDNETDVVSVTITYNPNTTTPPPVLTGYEVELISSNTTPTTDLETIEVFTLSVKDDKGNLVATTDVNATITSNQPNLAKFLDENGTELTTLTFTEKNPATLRLKTYTIAGLADFDIQLQIRDANGAIGDKNVTKAITIFSGPATAMSITYKGTGQDTAANQFIEQMVVQLSDKWGNPVNTGPSIYAGALAGYTHSTGSVTGNEYLVNETAVATIATDPLGAKLTDTSGIDLTEVDPYNDVLVSFGNGYTYQVSGKWDIDSVVGADIFLKDTYTEADVNDMGFAIGHNYRQDVCRFGEENVLQVDSGDGTYQVNSDGYAVVNVNYDYNLVGKKVMLYVNLIGMVNSLGDEMRLGEVKRMTLRGHGIDSPGVFNIPKGFNGTVTFHNFGLIDTAEYLRNAHFSFRQIETTGDVNATYDASSNDVNPATTHSRIYDCVDDNGAYTDGTAWIRFIVTSTEGGTITLTDGLVSNEF